MAEDFLSQEEVDALLKGTSGEKEEVKEEEDPTKPRDYNLATQERIVRGRMLPSKSLMNVLRACFVLDYLISCAEP